MPRIAVIGGGIIGLASAYYLKKENHDVVVIDKAIPGEACSAGNMGWVCPTLSGPVPAPGLVATSIKWMLKKDSPLYIKPTVIPSLAGWLYRFWRHCNERDFINSYAANLEISKNTLTLFDELQAEGEVKFEMHSDGLLFLFTNEREIEMKYEELKFVTRIGLPEPVKKTREEVLKLVPNITDAVIGGLMLPAERHVRPESLSKGLYDWLKANNVEIKENTEVTDFIKENGRIKAVMTSAGKIEADQFLLTTGVWSGLMAKKLGFKLPMTAGKGYSITIENPDPKNVPFKPSLYLGTSKVGLSPYNGALRIAGTMELSGMNTYIDEKRVQGLRNSVKKYLNFTFDRSKEVIWTGMRPMTPDGNPVLGKVPGNDNLYIATGHAMSGVSMSLSTGKIMSDLITYDKTEIDITPFSVTRF